MYHEIDLSHILPNICRSLVPKNKENANKVIFFDFGIGIHNYNFDDCFEATSFRIGIFSPSNYTKVFWCKAKNLIDINDIKEFDVVADHDSCWPDGIDRAFEQIIKHLKSLDARLEDSESISILSTYDFIHIKTVEGSYEYDREKRKIKFQTLV